MFPFSILFDYLKEKNSRQQMTVSLGWGLLIWLIIVLFIFVIARKLYITLVNSFMLAILFGLLFLLIFVPFSTGYDRTDPWLVIYITVLIISPVILAIYIVKTAVTGKTDNNKLFYFGKYKSSTEKKEKKIVQPDMSFIDDFKK